MVTASHNPAQYNGIKLCRAGASPVGQDSGLAEIRDLLERGVPAYDGPQGSAEHRDLLGDYADHLRTLVDVSGMRPLTVVVDAGNAMAGHTVPAVLGDLPLTLVPLYFELDGTFPHHEANPIEPENLRDLQAAVLEHGADVGFAFDGDADRCFVVDEQGRTVDPSTLTALIAVRELARHPGAPVIHNLITSRSVPEVVREHGGTPVRTRVGHSFIKARMAETGAVFGGEHSGHFYFRDFWRADSGMLAALHVLAALGADDRPLSELLSVVCALRRLGRDQQRGRRLGGAYGRRPCGVRRAAGCHGGRARRDDRELRGLVVQPASFEHRAAAAAQRRGGGRADDERRPRRGPRPGPRREPARRPGGTAMTVREDSDDRPGGTAMTDSAGATIEPWLLEILACPQCRSALRLDEAAAELACTSEGCGLVYRIDDGIPVLLVDEARRP
jgi:uncharacterized protein YbaR (Trm112 family)